MKTDTDGKALKKGGWESNFHLGFLKEKSGEYFSWKGGFTFTQNNLNPLIDLKGLGKRQPNRFSVFFTAHRQTDTLLLLYKDNNIKF